MADPFFDERSDWAKYKHQILGKYLRIFAYKLGTRSSEIVFVDTCAGAGTYGNGMPGSPLIAARLNDDPHLVRTGLRLTVIACEKDAKNLVALRQALEPYIQNNPPRAYVIAANYVEILAELVDSTRGVPTIFFIDPYGVADLTAQKLEPLLGAKQREPTEVLVRVPPQLFKRFLGWIRKQDHDDRTERTAAAFRRLLERLEFNNELIDSVEEGANPSTLDLLWSYLQLFQKHFRYVTPIPIRPKYDALPKYYMVHATNNEHGLVHMNDVISSTEDALFDDTVRAEAQQQMALFQPKRQLRATIQEAAEQIVQTLSAVRQPQKWIVIRSALVLAFGYDFREKDHNAALKLVLGSRVEEVIEKTRPKPPYRKYRLIRQ